MRATGGGGGLDSRAETHAHHSEADCGREESAEDGLDRREGAALVDGLVGLGVLHGPARAPHDEHGHEHVAAAHEVPFQAVLLAARTRNVVLGAVLLVARERGLRAPGRQHM